MGQEEARMKCGLCQHDSHPPNQCEFIYNITAGHSTAVVERIPCACWLDMREER